jgi:hypothetical protein
MRLQRLRIARGTSPTTSSTVFVLSPKDKLSRKPSLRPDPTQVPRRLLLPVLPQTWPSWLMRTGSTSSMPKSTQARPVSFISGAFATADAFAAAYAQALAKIKLSSKVEEYHCCRHKTRHRSKICRYKNKCKWHYDWKCGGECGWWSLEYRDKFMAKAEAVASAVASSFASAWAGSLASIDINMSMRAYFKGGSKNVFMFRSDNSVAIDATTQCFA